MICQAALKEKFLEAFALVKNPATWTKHTNARDVCEYSVSADSPRAVKFCAIGAIQRVSYQEDTIELYYKLRNPLFEQLRIDFSVADSDDLEYPISSFNDTRSHRQVVAWWRRTGKRMGWL